MRALLATLLCLPALGLPSAAVAGDPCPIDFTFHDLGAPHWLKRDALLDKLASKDSWIGLSFKTGKGGVLLTNVSTGSPAETAGLKIGDLVTAAGGTPVKTHGVFGDMLRATAPGAKLSLSVSRDGKSKDVALVLGRQDPVLGALVDHASRQACASVTRGDVPAKWAKKIRKKLFHKNRRFRCDSAHGALAEEMEGGQIVMIRGKKRVLLTNPGWATVCVRAAEVDGKQLTQAAIASIFDRLTKAYVQDRHDNP